MSVGRRRDAEREPAEETPPEASKAEKLPEEALDFDLPVNGEDEVVGLDTSTGLDDEEPLFELDMPPASDDGPDGTAQEVEDWSVEFEQLDAEPSWLDAGAQADETDDEDVDLRVPPPLGEDDLGEAGLDEPALPSHALALPPLDAPDGAEVGLGGDDLEEGLEGDWLAVELPDEPLDAPPRFGTIERASARPIGPRRAPVRAYDAQAEVWATSDALYVDGGRRRLAGGGLEGHELVSLAVDPERPSRWVVGTRDAGVFRSDDGGERFVASSPEGTRPKGAFHLAVERRPGGSATLWGRTERGALYRSSDFGGAFQGPLLLASVRAMVALEPRGLLVVCAGRDAPVRLAHTLDGGARWSSTAGPPVPPSARSKLWLSATRGGTNLAIAAEGDEGGVWLSRDRGRSWTRSSTWGAAPLHGPIALLEEPGGLSLYGVLRSDGRVSIVRKGASDAAGGSVLEVLPAPQHHVEAAEPGPEDAEAGRVYTLAGRCDQHRTVLEVGAWCGFFEVSVDLG